MSDEAATLCPVFWAFLAFQLLTGILLTRIKPWPFDPEHIRGKRQRHSGRETESFVFCFFFRKGDLTEKGQSSKTPICRLLALLDESWERSHFPDAVHKRLQLLQWVQSACSCIQLPFFFVTLLFSPHEDAHKYHNLTHSFERQQQHHSEKEICGN